MTPTARIPVLECRQVWPGVESALADFFRVLQESGVASTFHPHPFTPEQARRLAAYQGADIYVVLLEGDVVSKLPVLGYGLLRGWDEGYVTPSLGIAIHPRFRGQGLGRLMMEYLHVAARRRGAQKVRLKVYKENGAAVRLYESMGYRFEPQLESGQLVGFLSL